MDLRDKILMKGKLIPILDEVIYRYDELVIFF